MKLSVSKKIQDYLTLERMFFLSKNISTIDKLTYSLHKYNSVLSNIKQVRYINNEFYFDNRFTPILLLGYPYEISELNNAVNLNNVKSILDIGANIGQWSFTLKSMFPHVRIDSLEPNSNIFPLLVKNSNQYANWNVHNIGFGYSNKHKFLYYSGEGSSEASVYANNTDSRGQKRVPITLISATESTLRKYNLLRSYDLVKIDVEGYEKEVLNSIKSIQYNYLSIEVSLKRSRGMTAYDVINFLTNNVSKKARLLNIEAAHSNSPEGNAFFKIY